MASPSVQHAASSPVTTENAVSQASASSEPPPKPVHSTRLAFDHPITVITGDQPQPKPENPRDRIPTGNWASSLFGCSAVCMPNFALALFCSCVSLAQIYARLGLMDYYAALLLFVVANLLTVVGKAIPYVRGAHEDGMDVFFAEMRLSLILCMVGQVTFWAFVIYARYQIRERFRIPGDVCNDYFTVCCCCTASCAITQLATHVKSPTCSLRGPDVLPPYTN